MAGEAVAGSAHARAAVAGEVRAQQAEFGHFGDEIAREDALLEALHDARHAAFGDEALNRFANQLLVIVDEAVPADELFDVDDVSHEAVCTTECRD